MKLAVGFITYNENSVRYLPDFLPSLFAALKFLDSADYQVAVFDNSDSGNNANRLALESFNLSAERSGAKTLTYEGVGRNLGFARAYNILINQARENGVEYFLIINPDTLLEPEAISRLISALDKDRSLAAVSPKIRRWDFASKQKTRTIDSCGLVLKAGLHFVDLGQGEEDRGQFAEQAIIGPSGAVGLFRLSALEKIKESQPGQDSVNQYFDEHFFIYKEDCDLAYRLQAAGLLSRLVPNALVYHDRTAASSGRGRWRDLTSRGAKSRQVRSWSFRNQHFLFVKHWKKQNFVNKIIIVFRFLSMFIFSLILEQFLLKQYTYIIHPDKVLTNVK